MKKSALIICLSLLAAAFAAGPAAATDFGLVMGSPHKGEVTQGAKTYPFLISVDYYFDDSGEITGSIQWTTLGSIHAIEGALKGSDLFFKEVDYIQKGRAKLNCVYHLKFSPALHAFQGTWNELGTNKGGTAVIMLRR
ncbi:MAG: hypothetical protein AB1896_17960 [Thermodesulfobacteriota bacterium]